MKKNISPKLKLKVALEAIKNEKTVAQICQEHSVVSSQVYKWKKQLLEQGTSLFENSPVNKTQAQSAEVDKLYKQIGKLSMELDYAKKCAGL